MQRMFGFPAGPAAPWGQLSGRSEGRGTREESYNYKKEKSAIPSFELQTPGGVLVDF